MIYFLLGIMNSYNPECKTTKENFVTDFIEANAYRVLVKFVFEIISDLEKIERAKLEEVLGLIK